MSYEIVDITVGNSTETVSINKSLWARDNNPGWGALIEVYFGQRSTLDSLKASEQPILEIPIAQEFDLPKKILIRSELQTMYKRVGALYRSNLRSGAIITGQPGCGKSASIPYFLVEQLADKRPVYVMDKIEQVYFITNMGTWVSSAEVLHMRFEFPMQRTHHRLWVLIDSKPLKVEPKRIILTTGFTVYVPSPARERYKAWMVEHGIPLYFLNPWVPQDLRKCLPLILESIFPQLQPLSQEVEEQAELFLDALYYCAITPRALPIFGALVTEEAAGGGALGTRARFQEDPFRPGGAALGISSIPQPRWNGAFSLNQYHMIQEVEPALCTLHVPYKRNNPLFNARLQEDSPSSVTLWVIQVTAAKEHEGGSAHRNNVKDIYNKGVEKYGDGNVRAGYMLLVPPKHHQVEWNLEDIHLLPENLRPSNGNVYVQVFELISWKLCSVSYGIMEAGGDPRSRFIKKERKSKY